MKDYTLIRFSAFLLEKQIADDFESVERESGLTESEISIIAGSMNMLQRLVADGHVSMESATKVLVNTKVRDLLP